MADKATLYHARPYGTNIGHLGRIGPSRGIHMGTSKAAMDRLEATGSSIMDSTEFVTGSAEQRAFWERTEEFRKHMSGHGVLHKYELDPSRIYGLNDPVTDAQVHRFTAPEISRMGVDYDAIHGRPCRRPMWRAP